MSQPDQPFSSVAATSQQDFPQEALTERSKEEKLQHDLFVLKKINSSFAVYRDALRDTQSANEVRLFSRIFFLLEIQSTDCV